MYNIFREEDDLDGRPLPRSSNLVNYSEYRNLQCDINFRSFSIKYVMEGTETYTVNGNQYDILSGNYLLANQLSEGTVSINSKSTVKGICIDIAPSLISSVVASCLRPDTNEVDLALDKFLNTTDFLENCYSISNTLLGQTLQQLHHLIAAQPYKDHHFSMELYYNLAEKIIEDHRPIISRMKQLPALKSNTKKDLIRRLERAKTYMDAHYLQCNEVNEAAQCAHISEYHFYRLFRAVYGISPYQYLLNKRLLFAKELLSKDRSSVAETAQIVGFNDIFSFSKAFKKRFGRSPTKFFTT